MATGSASADWDHWPDRLAVLIGAGDIEPSADALRRATELGRAVAQAGRPMAELCAAPWSLLEERLRSGAVRGDMAARVVGRLARQLLEGYVGATRSEEAVRREKERAQQYLDIAEVIFVALDANGTVTLVNRKACSVLGCSEQDAIGMSWFERFVPARERERVEAGFRALIAGDIGAVEYYENSVLTSAGQERVIAWHNALLRDEAGSVTGTLSSGEDVTDRRQAEREFRRYHEHLEDLVAQRTRELTEVNARLQEELAFTRHIVTGVPAVICRIGPDGVTTFVNPAGERITGYRAEELVGRNWWRVFYPGDEYRQVERLLEVFQRGDVRDYEMVLTTKTGVKRTISWNSINRLDAAGQLIEIIGFGEDVTERRQADLAVRESEERFRQLAENMSGFFWLVEPATHKVLYIGPGYQQIWGVSGVDGYADSEAWQAQLHPDDRQAVVAARARQMRGEATELAYRIVRPDGAVRWIRSRAFPIRDASGGAQRVGGIVEDVTEQKAAEHGLRLFKTVSDRAGYGSAIIDLEGQITYVNEAFAAMHGRTTRELLGQNISIFHSAEQMPRVNELNERLRRAGRFVAEEVWHARADGSVFPALMSGTAIRDEGGRVEFLAATAVDITERKRAQEALQESKEFLDKIINAISDPIFVKDRVHQFVLVNDAFCALAGHRRAEVVGHRDGEFFPPEQVGVFLDKDEAVFHTGQENINEEEITDAQRHVRTLVTKKTRYTDPAGSQFIVGIIRDITDRKRSEEALRISEAKFRALAETVPVAIEITRGARVLYVNSAAETMTGYSGPELMALDYWSLVHPDFRARVREWGEAREHGERVPSRYEVKFLPKSGEVRWADISACPFEFEGQPAVLGTGVDITDRKQAEEALRESEVQLRLITDNLPVLIAHVDADRRYRFANQRFVDWFGLDRDAIIGRRVPDVIGAALYRSLAPYSDAALAGRAVNVETSIMGEDGLRWASLAYVPAVDSAGKVTGYYALVSDITERKRAEEAVRQHEEQLTHVARVATVGEMASGLAHELSQPLTAILYFARGCSRRLRDGTQGIAEALEMLEKIAVQAERAGEFVRRVKAFVRKVAPHRVPADLNGIVHEALQLAAAELRAKHVAVYLDLAENLPRVEVDALQIEQVLMNLLRNAVDALEATPQSQREVWIRTDVGPRATICASVRDTGPGLAKEIADRIFDSFFTTKPAGTGLGLAISRTIIEEAHGGELWVKPDPRGGTIAGFALPAIKGPEHGGD